MGRPDYDLASLRRRFVCSISLIVATTVACGVASGASTASIVAATVPSAAWVDAAGCAAGVPGVTDFGTVLPGTSNVTNTDCLVKFGASNDSAALRVYQSDGAGVAMTSATAGSLDMAFDGDGIATADIGPGTNSDSHGNSTVASDGTLVVAGGCDMGAVTGYDFCIAKYAADGSLDAGFDGDGKVTTAVGTGAVTDFAEAVVAQTDGAIVAAGQCSTAAGGADLCLVRYLPSGALDPSFDGDGIVTYSVGPGTNTDSVTDIRVLEDGRILAIGHCDMGATGSDFCSIRVMPDGTLDTTWDGDGVLTTAIAPAAGSDVGSGMDLQTDGKLVIAGYCDMGGATARDFCLVRYTTTGVLDPTFDTDGRVTTAIVSGAVWDFGRGVAIGSDGKITVAGYCNGDYCWSRYTTTGALDVTFDGDGMTTMSFAGGLDSAFDILVDDAGVSTTAGYCDTGGGGGQDACIVRLAATGAPDGTFGTGGVVSIPVSPGAGSDYFASIAELAEGRIAVAGNCAMGGTTGTDFCAAVLAPGEAIAQYADDGSADWDTPGSSSLFGACLRAVSGGASTAWTEGPANTCPTTDGAYWNAIPAASPGATVARALAADQQGGGADPTVGLRFGFRTADNQAAGRYSAPVVFEAIAPNV